MNATDPLRAALERIAAPTGGDPIHREYPAVKRLQDIAREALAVAPEPEYEYGWSYVDGYMWGYIWAASTRRAAEHPATALSAPLAERLVWRRTLPIAAGEWERVDPEPRP